MPAAAPLPQSQEDILAAALAVLTEADIPPGDDAWMVPDPDTGRPAELAGLTTAELDQMISAGTARDAQALAAPAGTGCMAGFAQDEVLDVLAPGLALAGFADAAHAALGGLSDNELVGVIRGWRRQTSWAQARELAAVAELARRRPSCPANPTLPGQPLVNWSEFLAAEVGMALTLTRAGGETEVALAVGLANRPATAAALEGGRIDLPKARVILDGLVSLTDRHAAMVESAVLPVAPGMTTGELRAEVAYLVLAADPAAAREQRERDERQARVECWVNPTGTASLAGRNLPSAHALAADKRLCAIAAGWKRRLRAAWKHADPHRQQPRPEMGTDMLRARAYLMLLLGEPVNGPPADLLPPAATSPAGDAGTGSAGHGHGHSIGPDGAAVSDPAGHPGHPGPGERDPSEPGPDQERVPAGFRRRGTAAPPPPPPLAGSINLTLPLVTLLGLRDAPGIIPGYGPIDPDAGRALATAATGHPATSWGLIITDPHGYAIGYGHAPRAKPIRGHPADGWTITLTTQRIANGASPITSRASP